MNVKRLFLVYLSALTLLLLSVFTSMIVTELEASDIAEEAIQINIAGPQRMLSQRIIYLAQSLVGFASRTSQD